MVYMSIAAPRRGGNPNGEVADEFNRPSEPSVWTASWPLVQPSIIVLRAITFFSIRSHCHTTYSGPDTVRSRWLTANVSGHVPD